MDSKRQGSKIMRTYYYTKMGGQIHLEVTERTEDI